jgi:hypothetical protein
MHDDLTKKPAADDVSSFADMEQVAKTYEDEQADPRTRFVTFDNDTQDWDVEVFLYEVRQTRHLPPRPGYDAWTGVVVGGTEIKPQMVVTAHLQNRVLGHFVDGGLLNLRNPRTGRVIRTYNLQEQHAAQGKYFVRAGWRIYQRRTLLGEAIELTFAGLLDDGTMAESSQLIHL